MNIIYKYFTFTTLVLSTWLSADSYKLIDFGLPNPPTVSASHISYYSVDRINEKGQVVGRCGFGSKNYIYLWDPNNGFVYQNDNRLSISNYIYINNRCEISVNAINDDGDKYQIDNSILLKNDKVIDNQHKWLAIYALHVNNCGQVTGVIEVSQNRKCAVIFDEINKSIINFSSVTNCLLVPTDINDLGMVVGKFYTGEEIGFLWIPSFGLQYLHGFTPKAINNHGIIVGSRSSQFAVKWDKGNLIDISKELKLDTDLSTDINRLTSINDVNDRNQMVGEGLTQDNCKRYIAIFPLD